MNAPFETQTKISNVDFVKVIVAGLTGTALMTVVMLVAPMMGMPEMNIGAMLGAMLGVSVEVGWVMHFVIGIGFALIYAAFLNHKLPITDDLMRGVVYGIIVFVAAQIMMAAMSAMGMGSGSSGGALMVLGSLIGHIVYGLGLGLIIKR